MANKITYPNKAPGDQHFSSEVNEVKNTVNANYERLILEWSADVSANDTLALGQYIEYNDVLYRVTTSYDVGAGKTFTDANFKIVGPASKKYNWTWADGVDVGGTHLDFVITTATADNEISSIEATLLFIGGSLQIGTYTLQDTNFANDTIRLTIPSYSVPSDAPLLLSYNRVGLGSGDVEEAEREIKLWFKEDELFDYQTVMDKVLHDPSWGA
jgi:hypothetical protein